ncbi:hypothetical protein A2954_03930 [Candidatus Roizmanbacteria bacterium RIFCSPLOWO2_01_FULL_37_12]|uniref:DUF5666 domain-containing protein n=1 Tax=Candidatus Roizmanbacteria bacterium RIFCSPLOWO2_01_FULL_37_12 TaxID=1802056 RepID=A0A1F7IET2_9BACT|nr:MAG: hypothetical protein A3D76_03225 [Candidatus Roizmanbacteria bacterium RIFCSPHIGHO2_02_FULL_37_9b]OGK41834.1 MAG: hypothetical protein A2954_03930 [Candidatus Roizmanbacteria bacterium RIFCSPLOWO2_01_FULL_37_12]
MKTKSDSVHFIYIFTFLSFSILFGNLPFKYIKAQTTTSTASPTFNNSTEDNEIRSLKEKIATKVAELREKNTKAVSGIVQEIKTPQKVSVIKIKNWKDEILEIKIDSDLTKFYQITGEQQKEIKPSTLKKDSYIIATGIIKDKVVEANFVYLDDYFVVGSGKVTEVNKSDFFLSVITTDKENYTLDIETFTKQQLLNIKTLLPENVGFSKIKEGDSIHFVIKKTGATSSLVEQEKEINRFPAQRLLIIPQEYFIK